MNQSSSKTHSQKCTSAALPEQPTKTQRRKKQQHHQPSFRRNPLQDLNNGGIDSSSIDNSSNASSLSSIEAPKGCLRFFLSHSSSSSSSAKPPFSSSNQRMTKLKPSRTPKSAPSMKPTKETASRQRLFEKPISKKVEKGKRNHPPCLYQWQSGKKRTSSRNEVGDSKVSSFLESSGSLVNNKLKSGPGELKKVLIDGVCEGSGANLTPLCKAGSGSGLNLGVGGKVMNDDCHEKPSACKAESNSTNSNTKTPPVQPSVSPEIQCGSSMKLMTVKTITPATCYAAGHVVSGVTDKRKCRPRGILAGGEAKALGSFDSDDGIEQVNDEGLVENSAVSMLPLPIDASMHWLLSPPDENDKVQKENSRKRSCCFKRLEEPAIHNSPATPSSGYDVFSPDLCNTIANRSISTVSTGRRGASLLSPSELPVPQFQGFLGIPLCDNFPVSSLEEETENQHCTDAENSPFSMGSLGSGNIIQTPQSDSSCDRRAGVSWLQVDGSRKKCNFDSDLNSVAEQFQMTSLSPMSHASVWDPTNSSFRFDSLTMSSCSVDLSKFHKILADQNSLFSNSTIENVSQSQMRISWREGLASRIFEMDEFDCCRYLSDEEGDDIVCNIDCLKSHYSPQLNVDAATDHISINGIGSTEFVKKEQGTGGKTKDDLPSQPPCSCAESISTDGDGLVRSDDSDWTLCYKNHLFQA
ncbi:GPI-ANCHORED ADHESIN-LIKE PROTEIN [Salix koriyanagi]|uniref:GPI-ANCHORED ADHESIN-LIKE PROTEIN n=1 Tax=Salix koriyanagi TaxID=2511006 RepID=A0A9Q0SV29_9ROSI|nr:GPI-ANCHORED ADHESIN-LIKE PROTEIN [Salix koriyanagi]